METTNNQCSQCIYNDNCIERPENCPSFIDKYSVTDYIVASEEVILNNIIKIGYGFPKIKSHLTIGNMVIHNTHHFNWFECKMWKLFFGFEIENVEEK